MDDENIRVVYKRRRPWNALEKNDDVKIETEIPPGTTTINTVEIVKPAHDYYAPDNTPARKFYSVHNLTGYFRLYTPLRRHNYTYLFAHFPGEYYEAPFAGYNANVPLVIATIKRAVRVYCERRLRRVRMDQYRDTLARIGFERKFMFKNPYI